MKKAILLAGIFLLTAMASFAQSNKEEVEMIQSAFGMEKKAVVSNFIQLEGEQATAFWSLYDQYETERKANGQKRIELLQKYADHYTELSDEVTDQLVVESMKINSASAKLRTKYYKSIKKVAGSKAAAQFLQLENYFASVIHVALMEQVPFVGELD